MTDSHTITTLQTTIDQLTSGKRTTLNIDEIRQFVHHLGAATNWPSSKTTAELVKLLLVAGYSSGLFQEQVTRGADLVVLTKSDYDHMQRQLQEMVDALGKIKRGEQEYKEGQTKATSSSDELDT